MGNITRNTAYRIIYWHALSGLFVLCIAFSMLTRRIHRYDEMILTHARTHQVDPRLVASVIWTESRFEPDAVGAKGEIGLMQITPGAAEDWAKERNADTPERRDLFQPRMNVDIGCWYLARAIAYWKDRADDPLPYALAEYNAGRANVLRWADDDDIRTNREFWHRITFPTTKRYVRNILERYRGRI